jgi:hypothetical protein
MRDPRRSGRLAKPTVPVPSRARRLLSPSSLWTAESGFFAAAQVRRSLNADRPDADPGLSLPLSPSRYLEDRRRPFV